MATIGVINDGGSGGVVRWSKVGNVMYGYDRNGRLVATKPVTALPSPTTMAPSKPVAPSSNISGGYTTSRPRTTASTLGKASSGGTTVSKVNQQPIGPSSGLTGGGVSTGAYAPVGAASAPIGPAPSAGVAGTMQPNVPMANPGGMLGQVPNWQSMMGTYQENPQAWLEKVFQLQGLDPLGRNYAMAQAAAPYFSGMQFLAPFMSSIGLGSTNLSDPAAAGASAAAMLNWVANAAGRPGAPLGMPNAGGVFGNLASGIANDESLLYDLLIGQQGVDEQMSVLNDLISSMFATGSLAGPWAAGLQSRLGRLGSEYLLDMGNATTNNPLGPLVEYFLRTVGFPNARAAQSNLI
jgi:hypothetical protein